jgi:predicted enzyme related to lactoylglutathione lyase
MIDSISAVWLPVTDMERSIGFYRDKLGLDVVQQEGGWTEVTAGDQIIGLNDGESPSGAGGAVIAFNAPDIETTVAELRERGVEFKGEISDHPWGRIAPFADPDGNILQVIQRA